VVACAKARGNALSDHAKARGPATRPVHDAIAALSRRGALPGTDRPRKRKFVAVRVTSSPVAVAGGGRTARSGMVCRLVCAHGWAIECGEWPPPSWLSAVLPGTLVTATGTGPAAARDS
jgi:hypothetical protein